MNTLVVTHSADLDGVCSQEIARKALGTNGVIYLGFDYGQPIPDLTPYDTVYLIDISFPRAEMERWQGKMVWIDHHRSAIEEMAGLDIRGYRIDGVAACRLAWQWFMTWNVSRNPIANYDATLPEKADYVDRKVSEPYVVQLLGEYDVWDFRDANVVPFQLGMLAESSPDWNLLFSQPAVNPSGYVASLIVKGRAIQSFTTEQNAKVAAKCAFTLQWEGLTFLALNCATFNSSTLLSATKPEHDALMGFYWDGTAWKVSLRHAPGKEHHNLGALAKTFGGGGHPGAAGCRFEVLPFSIAAGA
jgi:oligoribonuclease NrnB/cAMP/cGMP phosphodiesterase (DHH superfamily)